MSPSRRLLPLVLLTVLTPLLSAQDPPFRTSLRDSVNVGTSVADVWGDGTLAFVSHIGQNQVNILDVSDPDNASIITTWSVPAPNASASAQDVKGEGGLMFVGLDGGGHPDFAQIVDVRVPATPVLLTNITAPGYTRAHNIFYDAGWLFAARGSGDGVAVIDLTSYDPDNPPAQISSFAYEITGIGSVHDMTAENGRLYVSDISGSQKVYDISDLGNSAPVFLKGIKGGAVHSSWPTADGAFVVTAAESFGGPLRLVEVSDTEATDLILRDSWVNTLSGIGASGNPHNPLVSGNRIYIANNSGGMQVLQIDPLSKTMELVASYDTSTVVPTSASGQGCWGVYPYLGDDRILASDRQTGFYVIDASGLEIGFTGPRSLTQATGAPVPLTVTIDELGGATLDAATVTLHTSIDGASFQTAVMTNAGGNTYQADLPSLKCAQKLEYYVTADDTGGETYSRPGEAPGRVYTTYGVSGTPTTIFSDDFEVDQGWVTSFQGDTSSGFWERGVPVSNGFQPHVDDPDTPGTQCYVTQIGTGGSDDVDGGQVTLESPVMDFSGTDGLISYLRWYYNNDADGSQGEPFLVDLSNDGGSSWTQVDSVTLDGGGWRRHGFRISDFLPPTAQMKVRFRASDVPDNSIVEAGVDTFLAQDFGCPHPATATARNGTGLNVTCFTNQTLPVLGTSWDTTVSHGHHPGATATIIYFYAQPSTGPVVSFGELLVKLSSPRFGKDTVVSSGTSDLHQVPIPFLPRFAGIKVYTQALILGGAGLELCNAIDLEVGY